jgi:RNA polymerase sigma-70 factor (ECF subfamily)
MAASESPTPESDRLLLAAVAEGDESAFGRLYDRFSPMLWAVSLRMLQDPVEAEDVMQETFMYVWKKAGHYDPELSQPGTWLCLVLRNRCLDRLRSRQRREKLLSAVLRAAPRPAEGLTESLGAAVEWRELGRNARQALSGIPEKQRRALELAYFGGQSHSEIASTLELPLGTVKTLIRQGLMLLRGKLREGLT